MINLLAHNDPGWIGLGAMIGLAVAAALVFAAKSRR